ncbi:hypothetical protein FB567DRAFT_590204 [Paraphoma chrysanthemicola]|uniref:Rhodopsin domain-containing protein n=1 Tax=Paraphoma chrysanthemicola TaxID=798071 RepID=A0A8K0RDV4_9PLEO|nr:hypothetical protein FB567DRAFT_590204 [Paraphoma chrysanthemicola]
MIFRAYEDEQRDLRWVTVFLTTLATLLLILRILSTVRNRGWLGVEDYLVMMANIFLILLASFIYTATTYGFGKRVVEIKATGGNVTKAMKFFWLTQTWYTLTNGFNKMAFVALYYRIFPVPRFRKACLVLGAISAGWTISYLAACIFQCSPVHRVYDRSIPGTCIDFRWHRWSNAVTNLLTDLTIFLLPMPVIFKLNMSTGSRISLMILFSMGFFICLTTALRMATLPLTLKTKEPSYESAPTNLWSFIEAATGVICACLICLRKSISALWPSRWRSTNGTSGQYQHYGSGGMASHGMGGSRMRNDATAGDSEHYALEDVKVSAKGKGDTYVDISPSESQERIVAGAKSHSYITTTRQRSGSTSESEEYILQGITVTTDVKVVRD